MTKIKHYKCAKCGFAPMGKPEECVKCGGKRWLLKKPTDYGTVIFKGDGFAANDL